MGLSYRPLMERHGLSPGPTFGCPYAGVGLQRALDPAIGFPKRSTNALWMLAFLTPPDMRRSLKMPPDSSATRTYGPVTTARLFAVDGQILAKDARAPRHYAA
jgi:hypothetical protein